MQRKKERGKKKGGGKEKLQRKTFLSCGRHTLFWWMDELYTTNKGKTATILGTMYSLGLSEKRWHNCSAGK